MFCFSCNSVQVCMTSVLVSLVIICIHQACAVLYVIYFEVLSNTSHKLICYFSVIFVGDNSDNSIEARCKNFNSIL